MEKEKRHKTLEELNVLDDFLFNEIITDRKYGKEFAQYFLKTVLGQEVIVKTVTAQLISTSGDTNMRAIRMDVVMETALPEGIWQETAKHRNETVTDVEMQAQRKGIGENGPHNLRRRSRFYQSVMDVNMLKAGQDYGELPNVLIIICTPFDLFDRDRIKYTFENICVEEPDLKLKDGAKRIFLNTKGRLGTTKELRKMLQYIEESTAENADGEELANIHKIVTEVKQAKERRERYMWAFERDLMMKEEGLEEGREQGLAEGIKAGREQGLAEGKKAGKEEGFLLAKRILHMKEEGKNIAEISETCDVTPEMVSEILF